MESGGVGTTEHVALFGTAGRGCRAAVVAVVGTRGRGSGVDGVSLDDLGVASRGGRGLFVTDNLLHNAVAAGSGGFVGRRGVGSGNSRDGFDDGAGGFGSIVSVIRPVIRPVFRPVSRTPILAVVTVVSSGVAGAVGSYCNISTVFVPFRVVGGDVGSVPNPSEDAVFAFDLVDVLRFESPRVQAPASESALDYVIEFRKI